MFILVYTQHATNIQYIPTFLQIYFIGIIEHKIQEIDVSNKTKLTINLPSLSKLRHKNTLFLGLKFQFIWKTRRFGSRHPYLFLVCTLVLIGFGALSFTHRTAISRYTVCMHVPVRQIQLRMQMNCRQGDVPRYGFSIEGDISILARRHRESVTGLITFCACSTKLSLRQPNLRELTQLCVYLEAP